MLFIFFYLVIGFVFSIQITKMIKTFGSPLFLNTNIPEKYQPFARTDYQNWNKFELYGCCIILLPIRLIMSLIVVFTFIAVMLLGTIGFKLQEPWPETRYKYLRPILQFLGRAYLFSNGFLFVKQRQVKYEDYISNYKKTNLSSNKPAIIISNHSSWYDTITYVYKYLPSFLSKEAVSKYPLFGWITTSLKSIYVQRESEISRKQCMEALTQREKQISEGKLYPPVIIFPEGTTTNGSCLLPFKKGAFESLLPVKICVLKYSKRRFHPVLDVIGMWPMTVLALSQLYNEVEIIEFEDVFDPSFLKLEQYPEEQRWEIYANTCRDIMSKALGIKTLNAGYRDGMEYQKLYVTGKKKLE